MTFHYIYFSAVNIQKSSFGKLVVHDSKVGFPISHTQKEEFNEFTFSAIHSKTAIFSQHQKIRIRNCAIPFVMLEFLLSYSVIDKGQVVSVPLFLSSTQKEHLHIDCSVLQVTYFEQVGVKLEVYQIVASKLHYILIRTVTGEGILEIYDGPGTQSDLWTTENSVLEPGNNVTYKTSSFQCHVHLHSRNSSMQILFTYKPVTSITNKLVIKPGTSTTFYSNLYLCEECTTHFLMLNTDHGYHLNMTIDNISQVGENNTESCDYAGLAAYDSDTEITTVCLIQRNNSSGKQCSYMFDSSISYRFQNIYSRTNVLVLVLYSFIKYARMTADITIRSTPCKPKSINTCYFGNTTVSGCSSNPRVQEYYLNELNISVQGGQCTVFQLSYDLNRGKGGHAVRSCILNLMHHSITENASAFELDVSGFYRGKCQFVTK